ncbi:hypothetical protein TeGR_g7893, partial [Tetraparma gracilis]
MRSLLSSCASPSHSFLALAAGPEAFVLVTPLSEPGAPVLVRLETNPPSAAPPEPSATSEPSNASNHAAQAAKAASSASPHVASVSCHYEPATATLHVALAVFKTVSCYELRPSSLRPSSPPASLPPSRSFQVPKRLSCLSLVSAPPPLPPSSPVLL